MMLDYYKIFPDWEEELNMLDDAARGRLLSALMAYAFRGEKVTLPGEERFLYMPYCRAIDAAAQKSATNAVNGAKGGKAKAQNKRPDSENVANDSEVVANCSDAVANCSEPVANDSEAVANCSPNTKSKSKSKSKSNISSPSIEGEGAKAPNAPARGKFTPPTEDEVASYAHEHGLMLDVDRFVDFYAAKGWKVGKAPMKDWRAAARNWAREDKARGAPVFKPPTNGEVLGYALNQGWKGFDYNSFCAYYEARGWKINGTQIVDWKPLARSWQHKQARDDLPY